MAPISINDIANVEISFAVISDAMGGKKLAWLQARAFLGVEARQNIALLVKNTDKRANIRKFSVHLQIRSQLTYDTVRTTAGRYGQSAGTVHVVNLRFKATLFIENLNARIFPVSDIDPAVGIAADVVRKIKLSGTRSGRDPTFKQPATGVELVNARVVIAVGHEYIAGRRDSRMGAFAKRLAAHEARAQTRRSNFQKKLTIEAELPNRVVEIIR